MKQTPLRHQFSPLEIRKCTLWRRGVLLIPFALACFALSSQARATCQQGCGFPDPSNTFLGQDTLISNTIGSDNTAVGSDALYNNTSGFQNTAMGDQALYNNTTGSDNTAEGFQALQLHTTGDFNTALGTFAMASTKSTGRLPYGSARHAGTWPQNLMRTKQAFDCFPERSSRFWRAGACDEHRDIGTVQNTPG